MSDTANNATNVVVPDPNSAEGLLSRIAAAKDRELVAVAVPEWGCTVFVRTMTVKSRNEWFKKSFPDGKTDDVDPAAIAVSLVVQCACDAAGQRIFGDEHYEMLARKAATAIDRIAIAARKANGFDDKPGDLAKN